MAARPPSNDTDDEPEIVEFGIAALDARVEEWGLSFPVTATDLAGTHGDLSVAVDPAGHEMTLREALARCDRESFDTRQELLNALHPVFEDERESGSGVLGRLRALVPF
ncbi:MAG: hypothetical protein J07HX64_00520 [halophilic archaeon J07HX64]|nr:MAG: hypothetical protein J07HX64_00520 [halophilic archaeon J07HX64]